MVEENVNVTKTQSEGKAKAFFQSNAFVYVSCAVFILLLFLRDACSVGVNKYLFVVLTLLCAVLMPPKRLIQLFCCLFPLYVGLPGNYMTIILIARLLLDFKNFKLKVSSVVLMAILSCFILFQELIAGQTTLVHLMYIPGLLVVLLLVSYKELPIKDMILCFVMGVAAMGIIMLISTLNVYEFEDLLTDIYRLGSSNVDYTSGEVMNVSMDPNFFGMFAICAISLATSLLVNKKVKPAETVLIIVSLLACIMIAFIGQSRAFLLVFVLWALLYLMSLRSKKAIFYSVISIAVVAVAVFVFIPDVMDALFDRFLSEDIGTLNNRTTITEKFMKQMNENPMYVLIGVGFFACNIHCAPLQIFFGGGLIMTFLMIGFMCSLMSKKEGRREKGFLLKWCPIIVTAFMSLSVPAAQLLNFMFPLIIAGLYAKHINSSKSNGEL